MLPGLSDAGSNSALPVSKTLPMLLQTLSDLESEYNNRPEDRKQARTARMRTPTARRVTNRSEQRVSGGWNWVLNNLKTFLETGQTLPPPAGS